MIIRSERSRNFTVIDNAMFDVGMSLEAVGLLCYLLSRPDHWRVMPQQLASKFGGRDRTYRILRELVGAGYIERKKQTTGEMHYTVFDSPRGGGSGDGGSPVPENPELPLTGKPDLALPDPENPDVLERTDRQQILKIEPIRKDDWPPDAWEQFWAVYPHKVGKPVALKAFNKARQRCRSWEKFWAGVLRYVNKTDDRAWCNPSTFLNQDRWEELPAAAVPRNGGPVVGRQSFMGAARAAMANGGFDGGQQ